MPTNLNNQRKSKDGSCPSPPRAEDLQQRSMDDRLDHQTASLREPFFKRKVYANHVTFLCTDSRRGSSCELKRQCVVLEALQISRFESCGIGIQRSSTRKNPLWHKRSYLTWYPKSKFIIAIVNRTRRRQRRRCFLTQLPLNQRRAKTSLRLEIK